MHGPGCYPVYRKGSPAQLANNGQVTAMLSSLSLVRLMVAVLLRLMLRLRLRLRLRLMLELLWYLWEEHMQQGWGLQLGFTTTNIQQVEPRQLYHVYQEQAYPQMVEQSKQTHEEEMADLDQEDNTSALSQEATPPEDKEGAISRLEGFGLEASKA
jgi:hypothetical protein